MNRTEPHDKSCHSLISRDYGLESEYTKYYISSVIISSMMEARTDTSHLTFLDFVYIIYITGMDHTALK